MVDDATLVATTAILRGLANESFPSYNEASSAARAVNGTEDPSLKLPGDDSTAKRELERQLASLVTRIRHLETQANSPTQKFPDTPNEYAISSPFDDDGTTSSRNVARQQLVTSLLASRENSSGKQARLIKHEELEALCEYVGDQTKQLDSQKAELAGVNAQLLQQKHKQEQALKAVEVERVAALERELKKHQQANEAFQKALREIGEIVTAVARGDLSKKVQIHSIEMDPEITTFKRTINTMMDQLQVFSSEVSRVAREVGTEGILGGQAQIIGVDGTWKELTKNGE